MKFKILALAIIIIATTTNILSQETKEINVTSFSKVKFEGAATWVLIPSDKEKVEIETNSPEIFNYIEVDNFNDKLIINTIDKSRDISKLFKTVTIRVYFRDIDDIRLSGVGSVIMKESYSTREISATLKGTGNMDLKIECDEFQGNMHGTSSMVVTGSTENSIVKVEGVGSFVGIDLVTENTQVTVSGVGAAQVNASNNLTATINGVGSIRYMGNPKNKNFNSNGLGSIKKAN